MHFSMLISKMLHVHENLKPVIYYLDKLVTDRVILRFQILLMRYLIVCEYLVDYSALISSTALIA